MELVREFRMLDGYPPVRREACVPLMRRSAPDRAPLSQVLSISSASDAALVRARGSVRHILYVPGPGDVAGTFRHWSDGVDDPNIPDIGYSHQMYELSQSLGARVTVLSEQPIDAGKPMPQTDLQIEFRNFPAPSGRGLGYHLSEIRYALRVLAMARRVGADTIVIQRMLTHFWPLGLARSMGIRIVFSLHNTLWPAHRAPTDREWMIGRCNGWAFRRSEGVLGVSQTVARQVRRVVGEGFEKINFHVPQYKTGLTARVADRAPVTHLSRLIYVGRIEANKGVLLLLNAFALAAPSLPDLTLEFVGDGSAMAQLRSEIGRMAHGERVRLTGALDGRGVFERLKQADLLVCPTTSAFSEGLAKTPIEAALCGVPSLVSNVVPAADLLGPAAKVVPADQPEAIAQAILTLARHPERIQRMAQATVGQCAPCFDRARSLASLLMETGFTVSDRLQAVTKSPIG